MYMSQKASKETTIARNYAVAMITDVVYLNDKLQRLIGKYLWPLSNLPSCQMGQSSSTSRAAKFSGTPRRAKQNVQTVGPNGATLRRTPSNVNRNCKEFSKFWVNNSSFIFSIAQGEV
jgi:hypothetical protein